MKKEWKFEDINFDDKELYMYRDADKIDQYPIKHLQKFFKQNQIDFLAKRLHILKKLAFIRNQKNSDSKRFCYMNDEKL